MNHDDEPLRIPISDVFDLHTVRPRRTASTKSEPGLILVSQKQTLDLNDLKV
jgi:hypothetical protein